LKLNLTADIGIQKSDEKHYKGEYSGAEWSTSYCQMIAEELSIKRGTYCMIDFWWKFW
jgi:hypothetical protein